MYSEPAVGLVSNGPRRRGVGQNIALTIELRPGGLTSRVGAIGFEPITDVIRPAVGATLLLCCKKWPNEGLPRGRHCCLTTARINSAGNRGGIARSAPRVPKHAAH